MRTLSNTCLRAALLTRRFDRLFQFFISAAFKARAFELKVSQKERDALAAVKPDARDLLKEAVLSLPPSETPGDEYTETATLPDAPLSQSSLEYDILWGDSHAAENALKLWHKNFPNDPLPEHVQPCFFERTLLNGSFKVTPSLRKTVLKLKKRAGKTCELLVVVNKTNTVVSIGLGQIGDQGGITIAKPSGEPEPVVLTDMYPYDQWLASPDFRRAVAHGWLAILAANPGKPRKLTAKRLQAQAKKNTRVAAR